MLVSKVFAHHYWLTRNHRKLKAQEGVGRQRYGFFSILLQITTAKDHRPHFEGFCMQHFRPQPPWASTTPKIEHDAWFLGFLTSLGFNLPPHASTTPKIEHGTRFQPPWASTTLSNPQNRAQCLVFGGFLTSTSLHIPQQPPKLSAVLVFNLPGL